MISFFIYLCNAFDEGPGGELARSVDRLAVVVRSPGRTINIYVMRIQTERSGFDRVCDIAVKHPNAYSNAEQKRKHIY